MHLTWEYVSTELPEAVYARLRRKSKAERRSIKSLVREAVEAYVDEDGSADPLDEVIGSLELGGDRSEGKDWRDPCSGKERRK